MPLLADYALAARQIISLEDDWRLFRKDMKESHIFELDADFAAAADQLKESNPSSFEKVLPLCRLPYDNCWFEVKHEDRESFVTGVIRSTDGAKLDRIGALVQTVQPGHQWMMHLVWRTVDGAVSMSDVAMLIDFSNDPNFGGHVKNSARDVLAKMYKGVDLDAADNLERRIHPYPGRFHSAEYAIQTNPADNFLKRRDRASGDWGGEWMFWMATVALLNSRNVAAQEAVDMTRENVRRRRLSKSRPDLLSFTRCVIAPRLRRQIADAGEGHGPSMTRAHFVRGHFKARNSGIFWWGPFVRGNSRLGFVSKEYEVRG